MALLEAHAAEHDIPQEVDEEEVAVFIHRRVVVVSLGVLPGCADLSGEGIYMSDARP